MSSFPYLGFILTLLAALVAIRGNTWNDFEKCQWKKITTTGYIALFVAIVGASLTLIGKLELNRQGDLAVKPIYLALTRVAVMSDEFLILKRISQSSHDERSDKANELLQVPIFVSELRPDVTPCENFIVSYDKWRLETKPSIRPELEMLAFMCKSNTSDNIEFFNQFTSFVRRSVCKKTSSPLVCNYESLEAVETRISKQYF